MMRIFSAMSLKGVALTVTCLWLAGCASTDTRGADVSDAGSEEQSNVKQTRNKAFTEKEKPASAQAAAKPATTSPQSTVNFVTTTLSNEETYAGQIQVPKLEDVLRELEQSYRERNDDGAVLISYLVFRRLTGTTRDFLSVLERRGSTASSKDPWILIECAYSALLRRDYGMVQYLLDNADVVGKGKEKVAAAVLHARGLMFYTQKKTVLALAAIRESAKQNYEPAILTLTLFSLKAGDHEGAFSQLNRIKDSAMGDLNVRAALGIAYRLAGLPEDAIEHLRFVQRARPSDRRSLWNLALATSQVPGKRKEAIGLLQKYNELPGSNYEYDTRARNLLSKLKNLEEAARQKADSAAKSSESGSGSPAGGQASPSAGGN